MRTGIFYKAPPVFIGGRQPYAHRQGLPQSATDAPPARSLAALGIVLASWLQPAYALPAAAKIAPTLPVISAPPPISRRISQIVDRTWWQDVITEISLSSFAPQDAQAADAPPIKDAKHLNLVLRSWQPPPPYPHFSQNIVVSGPTPDAAPLIYRANFNAIIDQWKPKPYALPKLIGIGAVFQAPAVPDAPPVRTYTVLQSIIGQWPTDWDIPPAVEPIAHTILVDDPPVPSRINTGLIIDQWKPYVLPRLTDKLAAIFYVPVLTPTSGQTVTVHGPGSVTVNG